MGKGFICLLLLLFGCHSKQEKSSTEQQQEVTTYVVEPQSSPVDFTYVGVVLSSHQVIIRSAVQGELQKIGFTEGDFVKEGDLLFQIDPAVFEEKVKEAEADLEAEQANLIDNQKTLNRLNSLFEQHAVSQKDIDDATAQVLTAQANVNKSKAQLDEANLNLSYTSIHSPISGYTSTVQFQEGTLILPNSSNGAMTSVSVIDPVYVDLSVSSREYLKSVKETEKGELALPKEFEVSLRLNDGSLFPYTGKVNFVSPIFKPDTGTLVSRAVFPNPQHILRPGLFVEATLHGAVRPNAILVPQAAVQRGPVGFYVFVIDRERNAEMRPVTVGDFSGDQWFITSGLQKGDEVIVSGILKVQNGTPVKVRKTK